MPMKKWFVYTKLRDQKGLGVLERNRLLADSSKSAMKKARARMRSKHGKRVVVTKVKLSLRKR